MKPPKSRGFAECRSKVSQAEHADSSIGKDAQNWTACKVGQTSGTCRNVIDPQLESRTPRVVLVQSASDLAIALQAV